MAKYITNPPVKLPKMMPKPKPKAKPTGGKKEKAKK